MFTRITGDQKRYVEDGNFEIMDDCKMSEAKNKLSSYCKVDEDLVHLPTFYEEMFTGDPNKTVYELTHPVKKPCVRKVKIEAAALKDQANQYATLHPDKTLDDLIEYLQRFYNRDLKEYIPIIKSALCSGLNKASI